MDLYAPVESLNGIGPKTATILNKYGIKTVRDFLYNLPRDYENFERPSSIANMRPGKVVIKGRIDSLSSRRSRKRNLSITEGIVHDDTGSVKVVWFNQNYRVRQFSPEKEYFFTGNYEFRNGRYSLVSPSAAEASDVDLKTGLSPIYVAHGSLKSHDFRRLMGKSRNIFAEIPDLLPSVKPKTRARALFFAHFPNSLKSAEGAHDYLVYEELFELILASKLNRSENEKLSAMPIPFDGDKIREFVAKLPFQLTRSQKLAAWEIFQDMKKPTPMNRLLQGDVGSGKTMVAAMSAYETALSKRQVALLAPTAILATQHYANLLNSLGPLGVKIELLVGATKNKPSLKKKIASGEVDFVIGTHALLTDDTIFRDLALVIIDEQHRFGVEQRQKLILKSPEKKAPHLLTMTATPIPRSLQLTVFGDLDVSVLNELPAGRKPVTTEIMTEIETKERLYPKIRETLTLKPDPKNRGAKAHGQQVYWICKAIDETSYNRGESVSEVTSVKKRTRRLQELFPGYTVELLHGKMKPAEKETVMERFADGEIDILVSTTVVEVGVDVPNATLMVIENAESYGLAQLHQLRGRVGRGASESFCFLLTSGDVRPSRRLMELARSNDGFHLAEVDLKLRGPGEIYGALQHGALDLNIASLSDTKLIRRAQKDVEMFLQKPENMSKYKELMQGITKYQQITTLN
ncbi:ATP-dependent DNA helicase RecG [Candidatus Saccharibacteria bacterium]|nr:ATP-dependent DNA helicase RecG [Candidatus Saccharibacteria bacterium]